MLSSERTVGATGIDAVAIKPRECDVRRALEVPLGTVAIDYEGHDHLPDAETLAALAADREVRLTAPVRADGFDPLGDDARYEWVPDGVRLVLVAGHPAYLTDDEADRAVAPRLRAARERAPDAWVGTEGIERIALAAGGPQYELLSGTTLRDVRAMRAAGYEGDVVVYAPTVLTNDEDVALDAVGGYAARRRPVARALPDGGPTDARAEGRARTVLSKAIHEYALVGTPEAVRKRVETLKQAGVTTVVGYPARDVEDFLA